MHFLYRVSGDACLLVDWRLPLPLSAVVSMPSFDEEHLETLRQAIAAAGLEPAQFEWTDEGEAYSLAFKDTDYCFTVFAPDHLHFYRMVYLPGATSMGSGGSSIGSWQDVLHFLEQWLSCIA